MTQGARAARRPAPRVAAGSRQASVAAPRRGRRCTADVSAASSAFGSQRRRSRRASSRHAREAVGHVGRIGRRRAASVLLRASLGGTTSSPSAGQRDVVLLASCSSVLLAPHRRRSALRLRYCASALRQARTSAWQRRTPARPRCASTSATHMREDDFTMRAESVQRLARQHLAAELRAVDAGEEPDGSFGAARHQDAERRRLRERLHDDDARQHRMPREVPREQRQRRVDVQLGRHALRPARTRRCGVTQQKRVAVRQHRARRRPCRRDSMSMMVLQCTFGLLPERCAPARRRRDRGDGVWRFQLGPSRGRRHSAGSYRRS